MEEYKICEFLLLQDKKLEMMNNNLRNTLQGFGFNDLSQLLECLGEEF